MAAKSKKGGLGRGLDSLITAKVDETASEAVAMISDAKEEVSSTLSSLNTIFGLLGK